MSAIARYAGGLFCVHVLSSAWQFVWELLSAFQCCSKWLLAMSALQFSHVKEEGRCDLFEDGKPLWRGADVSEWCWFIQCLLLLNCWNVYPPIGTALSAWKGLFADKFSVCACQHKRVGSLLTPEVAAWDLPTWVSFKLVNKDQT